MTKWLALGKALLALGAAAAMIFNRGNADVATIAILAFAITAFALEGALNRHRAIVAGIYAVGFILIVTFASVMASLPTAMDRFFMLALLTAFFQLLAVTAINFRDGWFKKEHRFQLINWVLHLALWSAFIWLNPGAIAAVGMTGTYLAILAVHWGIEAVGPAASKAD